MSNNKTFPDFLLKFSSYSRLIRILALCLRFIYNSRQCNRNSRNRGLLTTSEILNATLCVLKLVQEQELSLELNLLKKNQPLPFNSKYLSLNIFLGDQGLIRVGGRLSRHQSLNQDQKFPVLLPKNHLITKLIVEQYHKQHFHTGAQLILSLIRQRYWIPNGRSFIRQVLNNCLLCKRLKKQACQQLMGELPVERITPSRPFSKVGVDYAGPLITKPNVPKSKTKLNCNYDPQAPPLQWKLGRINCTHPGPDLRVQVVSIRTQDGEIQRPISKVTLLLPAGENVQVSQDYNSKSCHQRVTPETGDCLKELL
ncbi:integrase catalytic domain-containing protein [Trichonephila clavipes]|nr:integrase catalytic domain-containing protein [Trichonephila clavipes]